MNNLMYRRRTFMKQAALDGGILILPHQNRLWQSDEKEQGKRVGITGLDTSHSTAFTKVLNAPEPNPYYAGYKVVTAYPYGSKDIESSMKRIPGYSEEVKKMNVEIVDSLADLLKEVDVVLGVEKLYTVMGTGCREVVRVHTENTVVKRNYRVLRNRQSTRFSGRNHRDFCLYGSG